MEFLTAHGSDLLFYLFALLAVGGALGVVTLRSPMYGALSLLVTFLAVAVLFLLRNAEFLGIVQIFVYGGGIMVLFGYFFVHIAFGPAFIQPETFKNVQGAAVGNSQAVAWNLFTQALLPFEIASIFLLVAMIGAVVLGRRQ